MIRFCDKEVVCVTVDGITRSELLSHFLRGHMNDVIVVLNEMGQYLGKITYSLLLMHQDIIEAIDTSYVILDEQIWNNGRKFFLEYKNIMGEYPLLSVLNQEKQLLCFAYEDEEANREIRMLRELESCEAALGFQELYPEYDCVTIEGCNELAYYFAEYLKKQNVSVNVIGDLWEELGVWEKHAVLDYKNFYVYAEGTEPVHTDFTYRLLHSVSPEFECINVIYEANLNQKIIVDAEYDWSVLVEKLHDEQEIIILGVGEKSQDVYDFFLLNGVECCCFAENVGEVKHKLFGKEIISEKEAMIRFKQPVFVECCSKYSTWGSDGVDNYDYYGFHRNEKFFVIQDYMEVPKNSLQHVVNENKVVLAGDIYLCYKLYCYFKQRTSNPIGYLEIGKRKHRNSFEMREWKQEELNENDLCLVVLPEYIPCDRKKGVEKCKEHKDNCIRKLYEMGIVNYTDYFSRQEAFLYVTEEECEYNKSELKPKALLFGNIPAFSGNYFIRDVLGGHTDILFMDYTYLNHNLYQLCIRLSMVRACEISELFWRLYEEEAGTENIKVDFPKRELFQKELERLLLFKEAFTSQELFIIFHMAYGKMCGKEVSDINSIVIYWEPHHISRQFLIKSARWLESRDVSVYLLKMTRNRYIAAGSCIRCGETFLNWESKNIRENLLYHITLSVDGNDCEQNKREQVVIRFEDFKCNPLEVYRGLCQKLGISWSDSLIENVRDNQYEGIAKGFDLKPVYNNYEEYFSGYDRMKISLIQSQYQKKYGYPYMNVNDFSRKELQSMFLKEFRFEKKMINSYSEEMKLDYSMFKQRLVCEKLWELRQLERIEKQEEN